MANVALIVTMVISLFLLFASMVLSAIASASAENKDNVKAQKYAMYAAILNGVSVAVMGVILSMYVYITRNEYADQARSLLTGARGRLGL